MSSDRFLKIPNHSKESANEPENLCDHGSKFSVQNAYYQSKLAQVMHTYRLAEELRQTAVTVNSIRVTNVKIDLDSRYPGMSQLARKMYRLKSSFSISP